MCLDADITDILKNVDEADLFKDLKEGEYIARADENGGKGLLQEVIEKINLAGQHLEK